MSIADSRTQQARATVREFEFDRAPWIDAEIVMDVVRAGSAAQLTDTARRNFIRQLQELLEAYRREMWP